MKQESIQVYLATKCVFLLCELFFINLLVAVLKCRDIELVNSIVMHMQTLPSISFTARSRATVNFNRECEC